MCVDGQPIRLAQSVFKHGANLLSERLPFTSPAKMSNRIHQSDTLTDTWGSYALCRDWNAQVIENNWPWTGVSTRGSTTSLGR